MPTIAVIDDRAQDRNRISKVIASTLRSLKDFPEWSVAAGAPPVREHDILHWLDEHDSTVMVADWKLNEGSHDTRVVNYEADAIVDQIRKRRPHFPIYIVTGFEEEARRSLNLPDLENILSREGFVKEASTVVPQMIRAGARRYEEQRKRLGDLERLSRKAATGKATKAELGELASLNSYFQVESPSALDLTCALSELDEVKQKATALRRRIEARLKKDKGK